MSFFIFFGYSAYSLARFSPLVNPPRGIPLHRTERRYKPEKTMNPYKYIHPRTKAAENVPQCKPDTMGTINRTTHAHERHKPGANISRAVILDYILRLPGSGTRTKKAPIIYRGYKISCSCLTIQPSQPAEKVICK
nr:MAG TPA: Hepatitis core protein, putative zinc finger [Caudoviricetes sp.]